MEIETRNGLSAPVIPPRKEEKQEPIRPFKVTAYYSVPAQNIYVNPEMLLHSLNPSVMGVEIKGRIVHAERVYDKATDKYFVFFLTNMDTYYTFNTDDMVCEIGKIRWLETEVVTR